MCKMCLIVARVCLCVCGYLCVCVLEPVVTE